MWILSTIGFFSVVSDGGDSERLLVRARVRADLETLRDQYLNGLEIVEGAGTDYRYRAYVRRADFERVAAGMAADIDYSNFKNAVAARQGAERAHTYGDVWSTLYELQTSEAR